MLVILPTMTFNAETDQNYGKLSRGITVLLLCLPVERVHSVTQFRRQFFQICLLWFFPRHIHTSEVAVLDSVQIAIARLSNISLLGVPHILLLNLASFWPISCFVIKFFFEIWLLSLCSSIFPVFPNYSSGPPLLILSIYLFLWWVCVCVLTYYTFLYDHKN